MCVLSRLWFPCVDSQSELCPQDIAVTVPVNLVAVVSGELTDQVREGEGREGKKTHMCARTVHVCVKGGPAVWVCTHI